MQFSAPERNSSRGNATERNSVQPVDRLQSEVDRWARVRRLESIGEYGAITELPKHRVKRLDGQRVVALVRDAGRVWPEENIRVGEMKNLRRACGASD